MATTPAEHNRGWMDAIAAAKHRSDPTIHMRPQQKGDLIECTDFNTGQSYGTFIGVDASTAECRTCCALVRRESLGAHCKWHGRMEEAAMIMVADRLRKIEEDINDKA